MTLPEKIITYIMFTPLVGLCLLGCFRLIHPAVKVEKVKEVYIPDPGIKELGYDIDNIRDRLELVELELWDVRDLIDSRDSIILLTLPEKRAEYFDRVLVLESSLVTIFDSLFTFYSTPALSPEQMLQYNNMVFDLYEKYYPKSKKRRIDINHDN